MLTYHPRIKRCEYSVSFGFVVSFVVLFVWKQRLRSPAREVHGMRPHVASETLFVRSLWKITLGKSMNICFIETQGDILFMTTL